MVYLLSSDMNLNVSQAKAHLGRYVSQAAKGKRFVICERNRPVAELRGLDAIEPQTKPLTLGLLKGCFSVPPDLNEPLACLCERCGYRDPQVSSKRARAMR